eukprot:g6349.t1
MFDVPEDVPDDVKSNKRYAEECVEAVKKDYGQVDILVHSLANGPEVTKPLLETSRKGYLAASSASAYSLVSMVQRFGPIMPKGGAVISLSYVAADPWLHCACFFEYSLDCLPQSVCIFRRAYEGPNYSWLWRWNEQCKGAA